MRNLFTQLLQQSYSNQTNDTLSRDYRMGVMSGLDAGHMLCATSNRGTTRFLRLAAMVTLLLTLACGNVWADTSYYLQGISGSSGTSSLTSDFYTTASCNQSVSVSYDGVSYSKAVKFGGNQSWPAGSSGFNYPDRMIRYDCKTTSTEFTIVAYANSASKHMSIGDIKQAALGSANTVSSATSVTLNNGSITTQTYTINSSTRASLYVGVDAYSNAFIVQIIATEKGTAHPTPGNVGYVANFNKTRLVARSGSASQLDGTITCVANENQNAGNATYFKMQTKGTHYIKFHTGASPCRVTVNVSSSTTYYIGTSSTATTNSSTGNQTVELNANTDYYINPNGSNVQVTGILFSASEAPVTPTHTLTWALDGGTATGGTAAGAVAEGASLTAPTVTKVGYDFAGWSPSVPATMPAADATYTATWTKVYASGTYQFDGNATLGTAPSKTVTTTTTDYAAFRIDNIFFSTTKIQYETNASAPQDANNYWGWKIKYNGTTNIKFFVEENSDVEVSIGSIGSSCNAKISYTDHSGTAHNNTSISAGSHLTYQAKAGTMVTLALTANGSNSVALKRIKITASSSCTAPSHVDISGDWDYFGGETISLSAQAYSSAGTGSPIADGDITGYQWKHNGVDIVGATSKTFTKTTCTSADGGDYSCVVSTGATCSTESSPMGIKVYVLQCYTGGETTYNFTRTGSSQAGTTEVTLSSGTQYEFKIYAGSTASTDYHMGNNGTIDEDASNWDFEGGKNNVKLNSGLGGTFTFAIDYSANGGAPKVSVTYPRKTIYLTPGVWNTAGAKFAFYYFRGGGSSGWTDLLTNNDCGMSAEIPQWNGVKINAVRLSDDATVGTWDKKWNQTSDITVNSNNSVVITDWGSGDSPYTYGTYSIPTYTISYNAGTGGSGTKASESKTCGVAFTLPNSAVFTRTGYTQTGWTTSDGGAQTHALGGSYTDNAAQTFYPVWTVNNYDLTWNLGGGTTTSAGTGIASGVSVNTTSSVAYGTSLTAPTVTKTGYNFSAWSPAVASTMPAANTTYTATWTAKTTTITIDANTSNHGSTAPSPITATYGSALPSFTAAAGESGYSLTGYFTAATSGTKVINADGTLVASTDYADGDSKWKYETASLTLYPQYEAAAPTPAGDCGEIIKSTFSGTKNTSSTPSTTTFNTTGEIGGTSTSAIIGDNGKLNSEGAYLILKLSTGTFLAGDTIKISSDKSGGVKFATGTVSTQTYTLIGTASTATSGGQPYYFVLAANADSIIVPRGSSSSDYNQNPKIAYVSVCRPCPECAATPAAPTSPTNGATTSNSQAVSWTDASNDAWEVYVSTSSSTPDAGQSPTAEPTTASYTFTGLTASTTYYWWVRSVCDASHKSAWVAGSSFTTTSTPSELTAIEANVLYQAADMANITFTSSDQWFAGLSTNAKFKVYGNGTSTSAFGKNENHNVTDDIDTKNFTSALYITAADNTSSSSDPTKGAIEFITPSTAGTLYLYLNTSSSSLSIKKKGTSTSTSLSGGAYKKIAVEANTHYFINGAGSNRGLYGIKFIADVTAPTFVSSVPANGATGVATSGTIVLTFSEALGSVDASKFTLTGATKGAVAIDGSDATKVNIAYSGAANEATVTLATAAEAVSDLAGNALAAALSNISFTTAAAAPAGDCEELFAGRATSTSVFTPSAGSATFNLSSGNSFSAGGYSYSVKPNSSNAIVASPKAGGSFAAGDSLIVVIYNNESGAKTMGFRLGSGTYSTSVGSKKLHIFRQVLVASDISAGKVTFNRQSSDDRWVEIIIKHCGLLPSCTTPELPTLTNKTVCEGGDADAAWNATITNSGSLVSGETVAYSWVKKGGSTPVSSVATYQPTDVTEAMAGTYVVTATVSADGKASKSASQEVDLNVTEGEEVTNIAADKATVYPGNSVTLTATANVTPNSWQWYTCTNAEGGGAAIIGGAESASYTIASAGAAGTYYYKAVATGSCGTAERVYTLTVSPAAGGDCETYYFFANAADATTNGVTQNEESFFSGASEGTNNNSTSITVDGNNLSITKRTSASAYSVVFTIPTGATATLCTNAKANNTSYPLTITRSSDSEVMEITNSTTLANYTLADIPEGTWTLSSGSGKNWYYGAIIVKVCSGEVCTDPEVTASADNTTACVGTSVTFTAANAHALATYQWQKLDGTWTNISGADASTYNIASVVAGDAGKYRVIASHDCNRTSNEVTLSVPSAPNFGSTVPASVSVMQTIALSINTVEATDAVKYRWYKSADPTWDAGDVEIGTNKELIKAYDSEAIGSPSYYIFCRAQNACGITTSSAIAVNVTAYVEEDCAIRGNENEAEFGFDNTSMSSGTYDSKNVWYKNSNSAYLTYTAPTGKYFKTAKVTIASSNSSNASYQWSADGSSWTAVTISGLTTTLTETEINLAAKGSGRVTHFRIGRNLGNAGESSGTFYLHKACFEYTDACTATTVTPDESSKTYEMGSGSFTEPTFTVKHGGTAFDPQPTLTYSSSNEDIASVDDDGTVTFNGDAGTVTITASYAGDGTYCASEGSYTITVSCSGGAPKVVPDGSVNMSGCNSSVILHAKQQDGTSDFADGTYQWFRNGTEIDGATSSSYTATQAGTYTVERTNGTGCTTPSTNNVVITSETTEPEVERLVPFQYYHVDKTYSDQMKMRHLFAVKNSGKLDGKSFKMYVSRNGGAATDVTSSNALVVRSNDDGHVDTVKVDLNELSGKYSENEEVVFTCKAIDCSGNVSEVYKETITMNVIGATPTLALICSGSSKAGGTRKTDELTVGGDFLTGYNVADLCQQTGNTSFDGNTEWGLYTDLKTQYIVTPVNGYAVFNKLNYEPFDILLLTDYPKASKSDAAADVLDDMAALCDYRPMLSFKTHMVAKSPSKWAEKGFTTSPVVTKADGRLNLNIVCYAHPMFNSLKTGDDVYTDVGNTSAPLVYTMLSGTGYESSKGMQGFELAAAENFVTIGLTHYNGTIAKNSPDPGEVEWTPGSEDRMLVTVAERQANPEARFILFSLNCGAQSKLTDKGEEVILACLNYLLGTAEGTIEPADCSFTFDNGENNEHNAAWYASNCPLCTGTKGDGKWTTAANWGPDYRLLPGEFTSVRIKKPVEVNDEHAHVMEVRIIDEGSVDIPAGKALDVKSTIRRMDGSEIYPTEISDIHIGSASTGNGTLIFNNDDGHTKARVDMYSTAKADAGLSAAASTWQYIGTPHSDVASATHNYYNSWLYQYSGSGWDVIPNGGPLVPFRGYCVTHPDAPVVFGMEGTLVATTAQSIAIPVGYTVIANSWVAPIDISTFTDDDMENISDKTIYFFNTGSDADGTAGTGTEAGTYVAVPKNSASYVGTWQIPSMQGFYISTTSAGTLHLDYDRHVRPHSARTVVSNSMYAPRRAKAAEEEPAVLKIFARGSRYQDKLVVLEREDFTRGYDSGWDGEAWGGGTLSPMVYVTGEGREDAVSAIPEFEGTVVAFKAGEDSEYRFEFIYDGDESLYLFDTENNTYTQIMTGESYYFSTDDKAPHSRFILTRKAPQIATGVEPTSDGEGAKARKLLIEDKMYILLNGMLYDATGKVVK